MESSFVKVGVICDNPYLSFYLQEYLSQKPNFIVANYDFNHFDTNLDVYICLTGKSENLGKFGDLKGYKIIITNNFTEGFILKLLQNGFTTIYDKNVNLSELLKLGLHLYIYKEDVLSNLEELFKTLKGKKIVTDFNTSVIGNYINYNL